MPDAKIKRSDLWLIFAAGLATRLVFFSFSVSQVGADNIWTLTPDTQNYLKIALDFLNGTNLAKEHLFMFGPGFGAFLALLIAFLGQNGALIVFLQILLSSASSVMIYILARELTLSRSVGIFAASLFVILPTSISLSCIILSETLFMFLLLLGSILYLRGLRTKSWKPFVFSGLLFSLAVLVRAVGQFIPLVLLLISVPYVLSRSSTSRWKYSMDRRLLGWVLVCVTIIGVTEGSWMLRNQSQHGIFALTSGSSGGIANVVAYAVERMGGPPFREVRSGWHTQYFADHGIDSATVESFHAADMHYAPPVIKEHPWAVMGAYLSLTWENVTAINYLNRLLLPESQGGVFRFEHFISNNHVTRLEFWLAIAGLLILLIRRQFKPAMFLGLMFVYFALIIGFTRWQGSRLFFPAEMASLILVAISLTSLGQLAGKAFKIRQRVIPFLKQLVGGIDGGDGTPARFTLRIFWRMEFSFVISWANIF